MSFTLSQDLHRHRSRLQTTLTVITYYLLSYPEVYQRLMDDLKSLDPSNLVWTDLERRHYLWAVIYEALRIMPGFAHRSARVAPNEDLVYRNKDDQIEYVIPRGTPISMTSMINHYNAELFPEPEKFLPERWLGQGSPDRKLEKFLLTFSRGSRACLGQRFATPP